MKTIEVVAAVVIKDNKILCVQRGDNKREYIAFKYEFPGGKIEDGESREAAIIREIIEELSIEIEIQREFLTVHHTYPDFNLIMHTFICGCSNLNIQLSEHIDFKWLEKSELMTLDWAAADIPVVNKLLS